MSTFMFYKPAPRWQICAALAGSIAIHLGAVALATTKAVPTAGEATDDPPIVIVDGPPQPTPEETPPPIDIPLPPAPPPIDESLFTDASPPPVQRKSDARTPIVRRLNPGPPVTSSIGTAKVAAISAPRPEYPYEARREHATGSGVAILHVDPASGLVTSASMAQSTGNAILDNATLGAFKRWRFRPGTVSVVRTPITFTLSGVEY
jgi:TonB family protein